MKMEILRVITIIGLISINLFLWWKIRKQDKKERELESQVKSLKSERELLNYRINVLIGKPEIQFSTNPFVNAIANFLRNQPKKIGLEQQLAEAIKNEQYELARNIQNEINLKNQQNEKK